MSQECQEQNAKAYRAESKVYAHLYRKLLYDQSFTQSGGVIAEAYADLSWYARIVACATHLVHGSGRSSLQNHREYVRLHSPNQHIQVRLRC